MNILVATLVGMLMAQAPSYPATLVASGCVGDCGTRDKVVFVAPEVGTDVTFTLEVSNYNLCPSDRARAVIIVDGKTLGRVNMARKGVYPIVVPPGSTVEVVAGTKTVNPTIRCVELGSVNFDVYMHLR